MFCELKSSLRLLFVFHGGQTGESAEVFCEEGGIGEVHLLGYLRCRFIRVAQFYFYAGDKGTVYPVLGGSAAGLADDGAEITLCEAKTVGIIAYLMVLLSLICDRWGARMSRMREKSIS